jgi:hypothetical protein
MSNEARVAIERAMDERAAADFLDISVKTLQGWRQKSGLSPCRYPRDELVSAAKEGRHEGRTV